MSNVWAVAFDRHPSLPSDVPRQLANIDREKERIIKLSQLLDCEDELLSIASAIKIAYFLEASSTVEEAPMICPWSKDRSLPSTMPGGFASKAAIEMPGYHRRVRQARRHPGLAQFRECAASSCRRLCLARIHQHAHDIDADFGPRSGRFRIAGLPDQQDAASRGDLAFLTGRKPAIATHSVCIECKQRGTVCVMVQGTPCLGPVTHSGCGAICPSYRRGCYGCFGPMETPNTAALAREWRILGAEPRNIQRAFRTYNAMANRSAKRARPMATRTIRVDYLARVEGEGALDLHIRDGRLMAARLTIFEPPRFFEAFLRGRGYRRRRTSWPASAASARSPIR